MPHTFQLHERLQADTLLISDLSLCRLLLMNDSRYPWCILVPRQSGLREIHELSHDDQQRLMAEISQLSQQLADLTQATKMNVAALGNMVPQLHIHVIARFPHDEAWPAPVWGKGEARPYSTETATELCRNIARRLAVNES